MTTVTHRSTKQASHTVTGLMPPMALLLHQTAIPFYADSQTPLLSNSEDMVTGCVAQW